MARIARHGLVEGKEGSQAATFLRQDLPGWFADDHPDVRKAAAEIAGSSGDTFFLPYLETMVVSEVHTTEVRIDGVPTQQPVVQQAAQKAIGSIERAQKVREEALAGPKPKEPTGMERLQALIPKTLAYRQDRDEALRDELRTELTELLKHENEGVRLEAIAHAAATGDPYYIPLLEEIAENDPFIMETQRNGRTVEEYAVRERAASAIPHIEEEMKRANAANSGASAAD